ncbi:MAG TPA: ribonucleoside-diphosphate reductase subunit alpha, partial [Burkholderiaceae bacterium]|nr:ribonucleoside-diphosphate reductase subunit alpha [Burkholderiaceae bacterium]
MPSLDLPELPLRRPRADSLAEYRVIRRNGTVVGFEPNKILVAMSKAFIAVRGGQGAASAAIREQVEALTSSVVAALVRRQPAGGTFHIEEVQDQVELSLMRAGAHEVARAYVLYREQRAQQRARKRDERPGLSAELSVVDGDRRFPLDRAALRALIQSSCDGLDAGVSADAVMNETLKNLYDGVPLAEVHKSAILAARALVETDPDYGRLSARLLLHSIRCEVLGEEADQASMSLRYPECFSRCIRLGIEAGRLDERLVQFDLDRLARALVETDPDYGRLSARLLLHSIRREVLDEEADQASMGERYPECFARCIRLGIEAGRLDERLAQFDLDRLAGALHPERDLQFTYLGLQTLYDRYFLHHDGRRFELPQTFFMRVAMGLSLNEIDREARAIEFYEVLSRFDFMCSTPTLFNSGTCHPQLSSCYLTTVADDLDSIYEAIKENALLAKYAGGLGNDWTPVRALGSHIRGTNGRSQGVVPFLKVVNDTAVAVNQGGKRKGAVCCYLEVWHLDIEEFLELRKNTGDDRRRTHDMNTANWIPDLFMKRVEQDAEWTLFSPSEGPQLHDLTGRAFEQAYEALEQKAARGELKLHRKLPARQLWRKMLSMLFETGHPWITFKDACNLRSPQQHVGVVHSSNLCTEITLNTSDTEIAVCNLGSINLPAHLALDRDGAIGLDHAKLGRTIGTAMRMLDNVIDINYYAVDKARNSNLRHRPVGMGIMGFQDCLHLLRTPYASQEAVEFADRSMEAVCYYAYYASTELA